MFFKWRGSGDPLLFLMGRFENKFMRYVQILDL